MINFFSTGYLSRYLLLILFVVLLWTPSFIHPTAYSGISSYAFNIITNITNQNLFVQTAISFILTILTALILNKVAVDNGFSSMVSTLVAFMYIIITSVMAGESHNNPVIWINFILLFVLSNILKLPYANNTIPIVFNASFLLGIASLFYSQLIFLIVFIWLAIIIHRVVSWRNFTVTLIGVFLPYIFILTWFFFTNQLLEDSYVLFDSLQIDIAPVFLTNTIEIITSLIIVFLIVISAFGIVGTLHEKNINLRKNLIITLFYIAIAFIILLIFSKSIISTLLLSIPSVLIMGYWFSTIKKAKWYNFLLLIVIFLIILNQYIFLIIDAIK